MPRVPNTTLRTTTTATLSKTTKTTIWLPASCNSGKSCQTHPLSRHSLSSLTASIVQCARSKSSSPIHPSSTVQRGTQSRLHHILHLTNRHPSCRRRDSTLPTTNPYLSLASPTKMVPSAYSEGMNSPSGSKIPTYVAAMQPTPRPTSDSRIPPMAQ